MSEATATRNIGFEGMDDGHLDASRVIENLGCSMT
jgi:hypothetical protein